MRLCVDRDDGDDKENGEADDGGEITHDGVEVAEHLNSGQLAHPHEGLHLSMMWRGVVWCGMVWCGVA